MNDGIVRLLGAEDIPGAMRLKEAAGWNQTERDWANVLEIEPEGCFALEYGGVVAATTTAVCYGQSLAWIGMVLTAPEFRGRGFARRLMERALAYLDGKGVEWIKLDATDMGHSLYAKLGFVDECRVERWLLPSVPQLRPVLVEEGCEGFAELDREAFGADRGAILGRLTAFESASIRGCGYAMGRPGTKAAYFGPCVCRSAEAARALLTWYLARHPGEGVFWDVLPGNSEALRLAQEFGFERRRVLMRMARKGSGADAPFVHNDSSVFAIAGFEYG